MRGSARGARESSAPAHTVHVRNPISEVVPVTAVAAGQDRAGPLLPERTEVGPVRTPPGYRAEIRARRC